MLGGLGIAAVSLSVYAKYTFMQDEIVEQAAVIEQMESNIAVFENTLKEERANTQRFFNQLEKQEQAEDELRKQLIESDKYANDLFRKLQRHDLTVLTYKKPGLIEKRVNDATENVFSDITDITTK